MHFFETSQHLQCSGSDLAPRERLKSVIKEFVTMSLGELNAASQNNIEWQFLVYDNSYRNIAEDSPVYFELTGGSAACQWKPPQRSCLAFVGKDSGGSLHGIVRLEGNIVKGAALLVTGGA